MLSGRMCSIVKEWRAVWAWKPWKSVLKGLKIKRVKMKERSY
jgi:hypothetical protein